MRQQILNHLEDPDQLEKLYRSNSSEFAKVFNSVFPEIKDDKLAQYWHARLSYERSEISWGTKNDWIFILLASLVAGLMAKIPAIFQIKPEFFIHATLALSFSQLWLAILFGNEIFLCHEYYLLWWPSH